MNAWELKTATVTVIQIRNSSPPPKKKKNDNEFGCKGKGLINSNNLEDGCDN